ncbi:NAD(P)H-binding protein [Pseudomonas sp. B21-010]|uniref:NAD(P)H-binding protein n=1 Tax=Pseudomonas sp. B21-010 TaxID=2895471 RepID=UPI002160D4CC|nr:NAD(P)H-binding protein [Pseudomonas sp. B21-010]UVM63561.1 NAD(P)H-binding protein [Pseudomonas sp. B21-010]
MNEPKTVKLLLVGASGLVGSHVLDLALSDSRIGVVYAPTRKDLAAHPKLVATLTDFERLDEQADLRQVDAVICTLGTTLKTAGSRAAFERVDHTYPLAVARLARDHGTSTYVLNSAIGADAGSSFFYNQVKGRLEEDLARVGFESLTYVRPGVIGGKREEVRYAERALILLLKLASPLLPKRWRLNPPVLIARALLEAAIKQAPGIHVVASSSMTKPADRD